MSKKDEQKSVQAYCMTCFVLGPGEQANAGEIYEMDRDNFNYFEKLGRVREATEEDIKAAKAAAAKVSK